jgi:nucleoside-diphosphate kinase
MIEQPNVADARQARRVPRCDTSRLKSRSGIPWPPRLWSGQIGRARCTRTGSCSRRETGVSAVERTLVLLKPDAVARGLAGRLVQRFEDAGLKIVGTKMKHMDADMTRRHYFDLEERFGASVYNATARFMQSGPVIALALEGIEAVANVRRIVGSTYPSDAPAGTIRGDFAHMSKAYATSREQAVANLVHASGKVEEAKYELELWFGADELFDYQTLAERYTV